MHPPFPEKSYAYKGMAVRYTFHRQLGLEIGNMVGGMEHSLVETQVILDVISL